MASMTTNVVLAGALVAAGGFFTWHRMVRPAAEPASANSLAADLPLHGELRSPATEPRPEKVEPPVVAVPIPVPVPVPVPAPAPDPAPAPVAAPVAAPAPAPAQAAPAPAPEPRDDDVMDCDRAESSEPRAAAPLAAGAPRAATTGELRDGFPEEKLQSHAVEPGDTLSKLAHEHHVTIGLIRRLNRMKDDRLRVGQRLSVPEGPFRAEIDRAAFSLTIFLGDIPVKQYKIGVGRGGSTPVGEFSVQSKVENPEWTSPDGDFFPAADPANPLGTRWIGVTEGYGIHGTTDPTSIGRDVSRGCVRLENAAVEEVYDLLGTGSRVTVK